MEAEKRTGRRVNLRALVIGGYGTFGGRLCDLLADEPRLTLIVAGRSLAKAEAFAAKPSRAKRIAVQFDRTGDVAEQIRVLRPDIVVDASGPFQAYGEYRYAVVDGALAAGADYIDLADAADFVTGICTRDDRARTAGCFALSGASSFPVLTSAAVRALAADLDAVETITAGIAPSPYAGVGINVIRAIASYAGKPVPITRDGKPASGVGLVDSRVRTINVPGSAPLNRIRFSLVDVPDLTTLATAWPGVREVWVGAGPTPAILHRALSALAMLVHWQVLPSLLPLAGLMDRVVNRVRWGEHRGGMFVEVEGRQDGRRVTRTWHMIAEGEAGPLIPSMAAEMLIRRCLDGVRPESGARPADRSLELADYEKAFAPRGIVSAAVSSDAAGVLYQELLGPAFGRLPKTLQAAHLVFGRLDLAGVAEARRGRGGLASLVAALFRFPAEGSDVPVSVTMMRMDGHEEWTRDFGGSCFASTQELGTGRYEGLLVERFGPIAFAMAVMVEGGRLTLVQRKWSIFGVPMPRMLLPTGTAYEEEADGRFTFNVDISLPLVGTIVGYRGWLLPKR
ncbi:DUF4166 domain-containing protein [soil metagenome]